MPNVIVNPNARSPYQRYGKAPTLYSAELQRWAAAIRKNDDRGAREADAEWRRKYAPNRLVRALAGGW